MNVSGDTDSSLRAIDGSVVELNADLKIEISDQLNQCLIPRIACVGDTESAGNSSCWIAEKMNQILGQTAVPINLAISGRGTGEVDLVRMKAIYWSDDDAGSTYREEEIPSDLLDLAQEWRDNMVEAAAVANEELMYKYLNEGDLTVEEIKQGLRARTLACSIVPVVYCFSNRNKSVPLLLGAIIDFLPAPTEIAPIKGVHPDSIEGSQVELRAIGHEERHADDNEPFSARAFRIAADPFFGALTFVRIYSGTLRSGDLVSNSVKRKTERIGDMVQVYASNLIPISDARTGDIVGLINMEGVSIGDTLCDILKPIILSQ
jgi:elongation factor G